MPSRSHSRSSVHAPPSRRESRTSTSAPESGRDRVGRVQKPGDRRHQPAQRGPVHRLGPAEVVDHLRGRHPGVRMPLVVRQLQVPHHRPVPVRAPRLPQVHAHQSSRKSCCCRATRPKSCAYRLSRPATRHPSKHGACNADQARICLPTAEVRPWLHPHYRGFPATTRRSASEHGDGTQPRTVSAAWSAPSHPVMSPGSCPHSPSRVPHESRRRGSRRLYAGHRLANTWAPARLIPDSGTQPGFDVIFKFSTRQQPVVSLVPT